ncbi:hypothetical protein ACKWRH_21680 [Bradyrhizobium sp. Pa8]|uniref:hypothetical protein n=1 Tax=Bradyrhizobium sp. Pa8 TaxID=3386552 RepID=UPI00403FA2AF
MLKFAVHASLIGAAIAVYVVWVRPKIRNLPHIKEMYDQADGLWQRLLVWVRVQWDAIVASILMVWPQLPDILQQISGADMSALIPTETTKVINQVIGLILIVLRVLNLRATNNITK